MADRSPALSPETVSLEEPDLRETRKRCSAATFTAVRVFRRTGNPRYLPAIVRGVLARYVGPDGQEKLADLRRDPRLSEDLAIDSLTRMEIALALEDAVGLPLEHEELRCLLTVGEIERTLAAKAREPTAPLPKS